MRWVGGVTESWRLVAAVALLIGLPVMALGELSAEDTRLRLRTAQLEAVARTAESGAASVAARLGELQRQVGRFASSFELQQYVERGDRVKARGYLSDASQMLGRGFVGLPIAFDRRGQVVGGVVAPAVVSFPGYEGSNVAGEDYFAALSRMGDTIVTEARSSSLVYGAPTVFIAVSLGGVPGTNQPVVGGLVGEVDLRVLSESLSSLLARSEDAYLIDGRGRLIGRARPLGNDALRDLGASPLVAQALAGSTIRTTGDDPLGGGRRVLASAPVRGSTWRVLVIEPVAPLAGELEPLLAQQRIARGVIVALLLVGTYGAARLARTLQRQRLARLGRFLSPQVAELVAREGDAPRTHRRELTLLFADARGFTSLSETLEPEELTGMLDRYLEAMTEEVFDQGGTLDKYLGDGLMAFFGDPVPQPDHALRAARCAVRMQRRLAALQTEWFAAGDPQLAMGIGMNSGWATVGIIGSASRSEYTAIGDNVNLASRLASLAEPGEILVSEKTWRALAGAFAIQNRGPISVKGMARPVRVFAIRDQREGEASAAKG